MAQGDRTLGNRVYVAPKIIEIIEQREPDTDRAMDSTEE